MVKGISRRIIVVKSPDPRFFDEAIFLVKEDASSRGITQAELLKEAENVVNDYIRENSPSKSPIKFTPIVSAACGAIAVAALWTITQFI